MTTTVPTPEMHQTKKGNPYFFGMKVHIGAKVEYRFRVIRRQFGYVKVRFRGLMKNTAQLTTLFALSNLWMARKQLIATSLGKAVFPVNV